MKYTLKAQRSLSILALLTLCGAALSTTASWKVFEAKYHISAGSNIGTASCLNCHVGKKGGKLNAYGKDIQAVMKKEGTKKLTADILAKVEGLSSTGGGTNISKIKSDTNPGQ